MHARFLPLLSLMFVGCTTFGARLPPGADTHFLDPGDKISMRGDMERRREFRDRTIRLALKNEYELFRDLVSSSFAMRRQMIERSANLQESARKKEEINRLDRDFVVDGALWVLELDVLLYTHWVEFRRYLPFGSEPDPYAPFYGATLLNDDTRIKGGLLSLVSEIVRMENAEITTQLLEGELALTRFLNIGNEARGIPAHSYDRMVGALKDPDHRVHLARQINALHKENTRLRKLASEDDDVEFALAVLEESRLAEVIANESGFGRQFNFIRAMVSRSTQTLLAPALDIAVAQALKESAAARDDLRQLPPSEIDALYDMLEPLDIIFVRYERREGNPIGFTQALVFLDESKRMKSQSENHPAWRAHGRAFRNGAVFLDAGALGVQPVTLSALNDASMVAIIRPRLKPSLSKGLDALMTNDLKTNIVPDKSARLVDQIFGVKTQAFTELLREALRAQKQDEVEVPFFSNTDGRAQQPNIKFRNTLKEIGLE